MEKGVIQSDVRHTTRSIRKAMQGNVIRALVELITNSDDSYIRLEESSALKCEGLIEIIYEKKGYDCVFAVRDHAEGMSLDDIREGFKKYGAATSGLKTGRKVRGYFGQGAKDALASMKEGRICSFKDDLYTECRVFITSNEPHYEIDDPVKATKSLREQHGIEGNGTTAYFLAAVNDVTIPRFDSVHEQIANNFLLRKAMTNGKRRIMLIDKASGEKRPLRYRFPEGKLLLEKDFEIEYGNLGKFPAHLTLFRSEQGELSQARTDDRIGGLLVVDDENAVLDLSLFRYDNEPLASRFFGELRVERFRVLLEHEEPVLSDDRNGLLERHEFCKTLIEKTEELLADKVKEESLRKQKEMQGQIKAEEKGRYRKAFRMLNEIAEQEAEDAINLGKDPGDEITPPADGIEFYPTSAIITAGKKYNFELRIDPRTVKRDAVIKIDCSTSKIRVLTSAAKPEPEEFNQRVIRKYVTIEGREPNVDGQLTATIGRRQCTASVQVVPEKEMLLSEGMVFEPENVTLRPNEPRRVFLCVYVKMIEDGSKIRLHSDNDAIQVSPNEILVKESDAARGIAKYEIKVWGEGDAETGMISAEHEYWCALLGVHVKSREPEEERGRKGMFSDHEYNFDPEPLQRTSYSQENGRVIVYVNFPSTKHYLGENREYGRTLAAQVLVADLVAERCFFEIARKKSESSGALSPEAKVENIRRYQYELSKKYGHQIHQELVDQDQLRKSKHQMKVDEVKSEPVSA